MIHIIMLCPISVLLSFCYSFYVVLNIEWNQNGERMVSETLTSTTVKTLPLCKDENWYYELRNATTWGKRRKRLVFLPWKRSDRKGTWVPNSTATKRWRFGLKSMKKANDKGCTRILHRHNAFATWTMQNRNTNERSYECVPQANQCVGLWRIQIQRDGK